MKKRLKLTRETVRKLGFHAGNKGNNKDTEATCPTLPYWCISETKEDK